MKISREAYTELSVDQLFLKAGSQIIVALLRWVGINILYAGTNDKRLCVKRIVAASYLPLESHPPICLQRNQQPKLLSIPQWFSSV